MIGRKIGKWIVLEQVKVPKKGPSVSRHFNCQCECGVIKIVRADTLRQQRSLQCRACSEKEKYIDVQSMIGKKYGEWTVLNSVDSEGQSRKLLCQCKCGTHRTLTASILKLGKNNQCHLCNVTKHGYEKTPTYNTWRCMLRRCNSPQNHNYKHYGARGITVCQRWHIFQNFLDDMGPRPEGYQLDRIDNNGNYEPGNCKWSTPKENSNNRRKRPILWNKKSRTANRE